MHNVYRDQLARLISPHLNSRSGFADVDIAEDFLNWLVKYLISKREFNSTCRCVEDIIEDVSKR